MQISDIITVTAGDIVEQEVDAIVNAANNSLLGGGGVDGAIHAAAGPGLLEECKIIGGCPTGEARITNGYLLPAKWIIHTVGPIWSGGNSAEDDLLIKAYRNSLNLAEKNGVTSIAFPAISTGAYGFPVHRAVKLAISTVVKHLENGSIIEDLRFVCFNEKTYVLYSQELKDLFDGL